MSDRPPVSSGASQSDAMRWWHGEPSPEFQAIIDAEYEAREASDRSGASRPEARVAEQIGRDGFEVQVWRDGKYRPLVSFGGDRVGAMVYAEGFNAAVDWLERYTD